MKLAESDFAKKMDDIHMGYSLCSAVTYNHTQGGVVEKCKKNLLEKR